MSVSTTPGLGDPEVGRQCMELLDKYHVLVFPRINLTDEEQLTFTDSLGKRLNFSKKVDGGRTSVKVEELEGKARVEEVARMLAGTQITDTSLSHARELIAGAARKRK